MSTGNHDDIYKPENEALRNFLIDGDFMPSGIQLPAGTPLNRKMLSASSPCCLHSVQKKHSRHF